MDIKAEGVVALLLVLSASLGVWTVAGLFTEFPGPWELIDGAETGTITPWEEEKPEEVSDDSHLVKITVNAKMKDSESDADGTAYVWYDADGEGDIDLGDGIGSENCEVESITISSGEGTSSRTYWTESGIRIQHHPTNGYVDEYDRKVPDMGEYTTTVPITTIYSVDKYTGATSTAVDQDANTLDTSNDYNYTTSGTSLTMTLRLSITGDSEGFGTPAYQDWSTEDHYVGPFCAIILDNTDTDLVFDASTYDTTFERGGKIYYIIWLDQIFNDKDTAADGTEKFDVVIDIVGAGDFDVEYYDTIKQDNYDAVSFGSADSSISDIDIVS